MDLGWKLLIPIALGWFLLLAAHPRRPRQRLEPGAGGRRHVAVAVLAVAYAAAASPCASAGRNRERGGDVLMGYLEGFGVTARQHRLFGGKRLTKNYSGGRVARSARAAARRARRGLAPPDADDDVKAPKPERLHGRHVLNRYEDGMEKCIGCELCAGVCPAKCIYVRGADNDPDDPTSPGERFGFVYEINYLRCIHCDLCVEACPTEAITETKLFEFSFTNRRDAIYTKAELVVDDDGTAAAPAVGGLARGRGRSHQRLGAGHRADRRRRLRRRGRLERRARLRLRAPEPPRGRRRRSDADPRPKGGPAPDGAESSEPNAGERPGRH